MTPTLLTPQEVAEMFKISEKTLLQCRDLGLRYVQITRGAIRYRKEDIENYIRERSVNPCLSGSKTAKTGTTTSDSGVVDFTEVAAQQITKKPRQ